MTESKNEYTIYEYYQQRQAFKSDWKNKLREDIIKMIDNDKNNYTYCYIEENTDYKRIIEPITSDTGDRTSNNFGGYERVKFELINPHLKEVVQYIEEQGLKWRLDIEYSNVTNSIFFDDHGYLTIFW